MLEKDLTKDLKNRLSSINGQLVGVIKMLDESNDPAQILNQFKALNKGLEKAQHLLLDEVFRKSLAIKIANALESCPGDCGQEEKIATIREQFPDLNLYELTDKMKEVEVISECIESNNNKEMKDIKLIIESMVCNGCAEKITDSLNDLGGVKDVKTKMFDKSVLIKFDPDITDVREISLFLEKLGYQLK